MSVGRSTDKKLCAAFAVLEHVLLETPGAPLKTALIDAGIGKDVFSSFDDGINQPSLSIIAKNANITDKQKFIDVINESLKAIVEKKINKKSLLAAINYFECI